MAKSLFRICGRGFFAWRAPRMWGILTECCAEAARLRFIPTRVGNTCASIMRQLASSVHPHACGEYLAFPFQPRLVAGSSPRVWGIPVRPAVRLKPNRFIPTRVGNTSAFSFSNSFSAVHPHACGEYDVEPGVMHGQLGSSPRVWGILFRKMQEITDCWQSSSVLPSHACCKPAPMTIKRGRSFVKRLLPLVKHCPAGQSRSLDVTCPDRRNARPRS